MPKPALLLKFRVYPGGIRRTGPHCRTLQSEYFTVLVFRDHDTMLRFHAEQSRICHTDPGEDFLGICKSYERIRVDPKGGSITLPDIGQILFSREHVRIGIVTHEMTHAALAWAEHVGKTGVFPGQANNEDVCYAAGDLTRQFWNRWMSFLEREKKS